MLTRPNKKKPATMRVALILACMLAMTVAQCQWNLVDPTNGARYTYSLAPLSPFRVTEASTMEVATIAFCQTVPQCSSNASPLFLSFALLFPRFLPCFVRFW